MSHPPGSCLKHCCVGTQMRVDINISSRLRWTVADRATNVTALTIYDAYLWEKFQDYVIVKKFSRIIFLVL
jgi:hypothetical protein